MHHPNKDITFFQLKPYLTLIRYLEDEGSNVSGDESGTLDTVQEDREKEKKKGKSSSRRNSKKINTNRDNRDDGGGMSAQAAERLANGGTVTAEEAGISFREEKSFRNHSKYRSCLSVRVGRTGKRPGQVSLGLSLGSKGIFLYTGCVLFYVERGIR